MSAGLSADPALARLADAVLIFFMLVRRRLVGGLVAGAVKG